MSPDTIQIASDWKELLSGAFPMPWFDQLVASLKVCKAEGKVIYPPGPLIFNAFNSTPVDAVKVVILGQDPYHNPGEAMGLSFSVPENVQVPPSLRNIYKELQADLGCQPPGHGNLTAWTKQGVLLLNAILTVEKNQPGSHKDLGWHHFTDYAISQISVSLNHVVFMLWGNFAKSKKALIDAERHCILEASHPSPLARTGFAGCRHFSKANDYLISKGKTSVNWELI
jgi:uracil-DNA glycosylase